MPGSKKDKSYANTGHRRSSIVVHGGNKKAKRDADNESVSSTASTAIPPPPPKPTCPLRPYMEAMFEPEESSSDEIKKSLCPLKRVKLSHTLPLMMFIMINMCLVVITLLVTGLVRVVLGVSEWSHKQSKETELGSKKLDKNALSILALALLTFIVTACYGPHWMSNTFRICTTVGFFGLLMILLVNKTEEKATIPKPESTSSNQEEEETAA